MWVEDLRLENIKCFERLHLRFVKPGGNHYRWVTLLGENAAGKSTALQALALLLAGPEAAQQLLARPVGWVRTEGRPGKISTRIHQHSKDPGRYGGEKKVMKYFGYTFHVTGSEPVSIRNKQYTEPSVQESPDSRLTWLRRNAFRSQGTGWFCVGYGAFRRLTRSSQIIIPSLEPQARFANFLTQFDEAHSLATFERWMVYLDYRIAKARDSEAKKQKEIGVQAINRVLPGGVDFDSVSPEGRIVFSIGGQKVPTIALSDGYRSVLALVGDLVWRLMQAFPESDDPLLEEGVVLIDELDIHLHPIWQRDIALWLQEQFPNLQFFVATHSPLIAAGAGEEALTLRARLKDGLVTVKPVLGNTAAMNVDRVLQSDAFGLVSPYSPQTAAKLERYDELAKKSELSESEHQEYQMLLEFTATARPYGGKPKPGSLEDRVEQFLDKTL